MERNSLNNNLKGHGIGGRSMKDMSSSSRRREKDYWEYYSLTGFSISWPPRSYTCSFCKREFRSAQALGGHMNVHRRDRARLRGHSPPPRDHGQYPFLNLNLNPNPNPNQNPNSSSSYSSSPSTRFPPSLSFMSSPSFVSSSEITKWGMNDTPFGLRLSNKGADLTRVKSLKTLFGVGEFEVFAQGCECEALKKAEKEDLDLELRLGCS